MRGLNRHLKLCLLAAAAFFVCTATAQNPVLQKIEPPFWWAGMANPNLQLMIYGEGVQRLKPVVRYPGVRIAKVHETSNKNYLFFDLEIAAEAKPGLIDLFLSDGGFEDIQVKYQLRERATGSANRPSFSGRDVVYLITPDRFANGDTSNDVRLDYRENSVDRSKEFGRHGGDLQGVMDHLDYIQNMGFTAIWLNPVLENNQAQWSYHGYSTTDYYRIDPRMGSLKDYRELSIEAGKRGIGLIMDMIANHCGSDHWWVKDPPMDDWFNHQGEAYHPTNHAKMVTLDPYASTEDTEKLTNGWFVPTMPDLNQRNPFLSNYLIQNSIWWIEYANLYGIREDTYSYCDKNFLRDWTCAVRNEYPNFMIVGEEWVEDPAIVSYWQEGKVRPDAYHSCLGSLMDFNLMAQLVPALTEDESWNGGLIKLYEGLARDHHYPHPEKLMVFADNHDMSRIFTRLNGDLSLFKMAMTYVLTIRGIPQVYYGTEILMDHPGTDSHGAIRSDFPGGWPGDEVNAFTGEGLAAEKLEAQTWLKTLLAWRKNHPAIHSGQTVHFRPHDGVYVYFRFNGEEKIMVVLNKNKKDRVLQPSDYQSVLTGHTRALRFPNAEVFSLDADVTIPGQSASIFEIK